jgi:hypothetical protein
MDVAALGLHYGARTGLSQEDPRSQNRDLGTRPISSEFSRRDSALQGDGLVEQYGYFVGGKALGGVAGVAGSYRCFVILVGRDFLFQHIR